MYDPSGRYNLSAALRGIMNMKKCGIYIHIPFCSKKCPYCDFYSRSGTDKLYDEYTAAMLRSLGSSPYRGEYAAATLYFGGGTPGLVGAERLALMIEEVKQDFGLDTENSEITVELDPADESIDLDLLKRVGVNRISIGLQSSDDRELKLLGRRHNAEQAERFIERVKASGFENYSLDLMLAIPGQTAESLERSVRFCAESGASHISSYILKIEPNTVFYKKRDELELPGDDEAADMYEYLCRLMSEYGYKHYEISNFCKEGFEGKHNLIYWHDEEYLGFGPSAHSFADGSRFY